MGPTSRRVVLTAAAAALAAAVALIVAWRSWLTRGDGQEIIESPERTYRVVFTAETDWFDLLLAKGVWVDVEQQHRKIFDGFWLYKLHPSDDFRTAKYERIWLRENVLHLRYNEQIAADCDELVVINDTQQLLRHLVVHTRDMVLLLNFNAGEELFIPITRPAHDASGYVSARGAFADGRTLPLQQRHAKLSGRSGYRRFTVAVTDEGFDLNVFSIQAATNRRDCRTTNIRSATSQTIQ